jgi:Conserved TM helix
MDIGNSIERAFNEFFEWLPAVLAALAILIVGYFVAKFVGSLVNRLLHRAGFDRAVHGAPGGGYVERVTERPSGLIGTLAFWAIWLGAISIALTTLGIEAVSDFVAAVWAYLPNVIVALLIFLVAGAVAAGVSTLARRVMGETPLGKIVATAAPILVMTIATFMILDQLMIAESIVTITYAGLIGAIALGSALAFGLGGRDVARQALETAVEKTQDKEQFRYGADHERDLLGDGTRVVVPTRVDTEATSRSSTDTY